MARDEQGGRQQGGGGGQGGGKMEKFLQNITFPANKEQIMSQAEDQGAEAEVRSMLNGLPDKEYRSAQDVTKAMGEA